MSDILEPPGAEIGEAPETAESGARRWPRVLGTLGIIVGALMFLDKLGDLVMLPVMWSRDWWAGLLGVEIADLVVRWMPPKIWVFGVSLIGMLLGGLLVVGGLRLRRGMRSGVELCRMWSWLAVAWLAVEMGGALWWMAGHVGEIRKLAPGADWESSVVFGILLTLIIMAAFPVFLLIWFSRPEIKAQLAGWPR